MIERLKGLRPSSPAAVREGIGKGEVTVIDVNSADRWNEGHVPGAVNLDPVEYSDADLPPERDASLVFYCANRMCRKAPKAARRARKMGYRDVRVMSAGISGWVAAGMPTESGG